MDNTGVPAEEKKTKAVFGTTLDRELFPLKVAPTRFGNELSPLRGAPNRGPGCYNNEEVSNFIHLVKKKITSEKGYSLGARTAARFPNDPGEKTRYVYDLSKMKQDHYQGVKLSRRTCVDSFTLFKTPAPPTYQTRCTEPIEFEPAYKPFSAAAQRFPIYRRDVEEITPGPGTYEHSMERDRKVTWHQSFGGMPINLPSVSQHSTIGKNTEKLISTKDEKKFHRKLAYLKLYYD